MTDRFKPDVVDSVREWCREHEQRMVACYLAMHDDTPRVFVVVPGDEHDSELGRLLCDLRRQTCSSMCCRSRTTARKRSGPTWMNPPRSNYAPRSLLMPTADEHQERADHNVCWTTQREACGSGSVHPGQPGVGGARPSVQRAVHVLVEGAVSARSSPLVAPRQHPRSSRNDPALRRELPTAQVGECGRAAQEKARDKRGLWLTGLFLYRSRIFRFAMSSPIAFHLYRSPGK
jgi:hypothetical protein